MSELSVNQKGWLKAFDDGVKFANRRILDKLYYIPEAWKTGNTLALYNIIMNTVNDLEASLEHREDK